MKYKKILAKLALFAAAFIWGTAFFVMKNTVAVFEPFLLLAVRFTVAGILLAVLFRKKLKRADRANWLYGALMGVFLFLGYAFQTIGLTDTTPGKNAFLTSAYCILIPFLCWGIDRKRPDFYSFCAAVLCVSGVGFVSLTGGFSVGFGDGLTLISALFYAIHIIVVSRYTRDKDPVVLTVIQFFTAAALSWLLGLMFNDFPPVGAITRETVFSLAYLAVFSTAGAILLQNIGIPYSSATASSVILSLESVFGVLFSVLFYSETVTGRLAVGFGLIFLSVIVSETKLSFLRAGRTPAEKEKSS